MLNWFLELTMRRPWWELKFENGVVVCGNGQPKKLHKIWSVVIQTGL